MAPIKADSPVLYSGGPSYTKDNCRTGSMFFSFWTRQKICAWLSLLTVGWYRLSNKSGPLLCEIPGFEKYGLCAVPNQTSVFTHWRLPPPTWTLKSFPISNMTITWPNILNCSDTTVVLDTDSLVDDTLVFQCNNWSPVISTNISFLAHYDQFVSKEWYITSPVYATMTLLKKIALKRILIPAHWLA